MPLYLRFVQKSVTFARASGIALDSTYFAKGLGCELLTEYNIVILLQALIDTGVGSLFLFQFSGIKATKRNLVPWILLTSFGYIIWSLTYVLGVQISIRVAYVLFIHVPLMLLLMLKFKISPLTVVLINFLSYFLISPSNIFCRLMLYLVEWLKLPISMHLAQAIAWLLTIPVIFIPEYKYLIFPLRDMITQSKTDRSFLLVVTAICFVLTFAANISLGGQESPGQFLLSGLFVILLVAYLACLAFYARILHAHEEDRTRLLAISIQNKSLALYTDSLASFLEETSVLRHDQRHLLLTLDAFAKQQDLESIRRILDEKIAIFDTAPVRVAQDGAVNAIMDLYRKRAANVNVDIQITGKGFDHFPIPSYDLCIMLSNSLENAITATASAENRNRTVTIHTTRNEETGVASLVVSNPCTVPVSFGKDGLPESTNGPQHGYGTRSIQSIVRKYGGVCEFSTAGKEFVFRAAFFTKTRLDSVCS
ncbi:MAG: GHKL domain-containing protein [Treponema sp.]|nr:MAG: GHKL domain-containing protein [Treponema sp.]